jgi:hypothetical protein
MRTLFTIILTAVAFSAYAGEQPARFDYLFRVGVAEVNVASYGCLAIANDTLQVGDSITLITSATPQTVIKAAIRKKLTLNCLKNPEARQGVTFYSFRAGSEPMDPSIAIVRLDGDVGIENGNARADLNGDGVPESFRSCTSREGFHLSVWEGEPLKSQRLWHEYIYRGYGVEPTCRYQDYGE